MRSVPTVGDERCSRCGFQVRICQTMTSCDGPAPELSPEERAVVEQFESAPDPFGDEGRGRSEYPVTFGPWRRAWWCARRGHHRVHGGWFSRYPRCWCGWTA